MFTIHLMAFLVIFGLVAYVLLDGFDLGTGIIFPFMPQEKRSRMMDSVAPFWDGNETWLVYAGGLLFAAFPKIYWITLPALYIPSFCMLFCLALRGVSFEFRLKSTEEKDKKRWENVFCAGSIGVGFFQGIILGAAVSGMTIIDEHFAGNAFDFISPLSLACGVAVTIAYAILGSSWQIYKMDDSASISRLEKIHHHLLTVIAVLFVVAVPVLQSQRADITAFILNNPLRLIGCIVLIAINSIVFFILYTRKFQNNLLPFVLSVLLLAIPLVTVLVALYPHAIPFSHTVADIANTPQAIKFVTIVTIIVLPIILLYTGYVYFIFKGKNREKFYS